ncbi:glycosyltransferase family 39 protein [Candidatus Collierbacteria bacterium]|nr:glycosyltransferase family 39 protein [Candidatus Collierbacteria bacterium]
MNKLLVIGIIFLALFLLSINLGKPFIGQHDWNGVVYGQQAKNFVRFGYLPLKFGATLATADIRPEERKYSTHYTPVLPILISFSYRLFGIYEWSTRLVPVMASSASVLLVILLGRELISFRAGIIAGVLMAVTPMFVYYGKNPVHEVVLLPFVLLSYYSYYRFIKIKKNKWWIILLLSLAGSMLVGWPGYYAAGLIFFHGILFRREGKIRFMQLPLIAATLLIIFFFHSSILNPQAAGDLQNIFFSRLGGTSIGPIDFLTKELRYSINLFSISLLSLPAIWILFVIPGLTRNLHKENTILLLLGIFGLSHVLIFRQAGYYHEYLLFPLLPFIALASAVTVENLLTIFHGLTIKILIAGFIIFFAAKERLAYLQTLLTSEYVRPVYEDALGYKSGRQVLFPQLDNDNRIYFDFYAD